MFKIITFGEFKSNFKKVFLKKQTFGQVILFLFDFFFLKM